MLLASTLPPLKVNKVGVITAVPPQLPPAVPATNVAPRVGEKDAPKLDAAVALALLTVMVNTEGELTPTAAGVKLAARPSVGVGGVELMVKLAVACGAAK